MHTLPLFAACAGLRRRAPLDDPANLYLSRMCLPLLNNGTRSDELQLENELQLIGSIAESSFPCEQALYLKQSCAANGTEAVDFLAEQQCLCNGNFWELAAGCDDCNLVHGSTEFTPDEASSRRSSLSSALCTPCPPYQAYTNLLPSLDLASVSDSPSITLVNDQFPNNTAVTNYFSPTVKAIPGEITGEATARLTTWTNTGSVRFTPTSTPSSTCSRDAAGSPPSSSPSSSSSPSPSPNTNAAVHGQIGLFSCTLVSGLAILALL